MIRKVQKEGVNRARPKIAFEALLTTRTLRRFYELHQKAIGGGRGTAGLTEQRGGRSELPMECLVFLDIETVTAGDLLQETGGATFSFPLSSGMAAVLSETLGLWLLITAGCLCEQPSGVKFTALCISTLCWAELPCTQAPWGSGAAGQASPGSTQRQHPGTGWEEAATAELWGRCVSWSEPATASLR